MGATNDMRKLGKIHAIGVLNHVNSLNLGDASLIFMIVKLIQESLNPEKIYVFTFEKENDKEIINAINSNSVQFLTSPARTSRGDRSKVLSEMFYFLVWACIYRLTGKKLTRPKFRNVCDGLLDSDLLIVEGGDSLTDVYGLFSLTKHAYNIMLGLLLKKNIIVMGNTIGPFTKFWTKKLLFVLLGRMDMVVVRDKRSFDLLASSGISINKLHFIPDVAFDLPTENWDIPSLGSPSVGIVTSALIAKLIGRKKYASLMAQICDHIIDTYHAQVVFVPHVIYQGNNDREIAAEVIAEMRNKSALLIPYEANPLKVKYVISQLSLIISPRMHPVIHALSSGVPVIAVDYNKKTREVMKLFEKEDWVIDLENIGELQNKVDAFFMLKTNTNTSYTIKKISISNDYTTFLKTATQRLRINA